MELEQQQQQESNTSTIQDLKQKQISPSQSETSLHKEASSTNEDEQNTQENTQTNNNNNDQISEEKKEKQIENSELQEQKENLQKQMENKSERKLLLKPISVGKNIHVFENIGSDVLFKCILRPKENQNLVQQHFFNSIKHEYQVSQNLFHPNIVKFDDYYEEIKIYGQNYSAIEMKNFKGNLEQEILQKGNKYPLQVIKQWLKTMLEVLAYLQQHGISHNKMHASNLYIDKNNNIILSNLKFANKQNQQSDIDTFSKWTTVQNLKYVGPEVQALLSRQINNFSEMKNDVYSLGLIFFEVIFGCVPERPQQQQQNQELAALYKLFKGKENEQEYQQDLLSLWRWMSTRKGHEILQICQQKHKNTQNQNQNKNENSENSENQDKENNVQKEINMQATEELYQMAQFFIQIIALPPAIRPSAQELLRHKWIQ